MLHSGLLLSQSRAVLTINARPVLSNASPLQKTEEYARPFGQMQTGKAGQSSYNIWWQQCIPSPPLPDVSEKAFSRANF